MKGVDRFNARLGANIRESIGATGTVPADADGLMPGAAHGGPGRHEGVTRPRDAKLIELDRLRPDPDQPRKEFDEDGLGRLAESLRTRGQLQPIRVRWDEGQGGWVIVSGERRWRAARLAGLAAIAAVEAEGPATAEDILEDQLVENCLRDDLRPIEQARAFRALMDRRGYSERQLAERLHVARASVQRALALLGLPDDIRAMVDRGTLAPSTAAEVARITDPAAQVELARAAVDAGLRRSDVAEFVQSVRARRPAPSPRPEPLTFDAGDGCTVTVRWKKAGGPTATQALGRAAREARAREKEGAA